MSADGFEHSRNFLRWKSKSLQQSRRLPDGIGDIIPLFQSRQIFGTMADENAKVMQPGRRKEHVIIEGPLFGELRGQPIKPRLVAEFLWRLRVRADVVSDSLSVTESLHEVSVTYSLVRNTGSCVWPPR